MGSSGAAALITAAGSSTRMAGSGKKEYLPLRGVPVIRRVYDAFTTTGLFTCLVFTCPAGDEALLRELLQISEDDPAVSITAGGETRQASVYAGLAALEAHRPEWVLIHDGSRPWVSADLITAVLKATREYGACIPVVSPTDTLVTLDDTDNAESYLNRRLIRRVQTPQGFHFPTLFKAHVSGSSDGRMYNDDSELYSRYGGPVRTIDGDPENRKITYPGDVHV